MIDWRHLLRVLVVVAGVTAAPAVAAAEEAPEFSRAETVLWMTDQLKTIDSPTRLVYRFEKSGSLEAGFTDEVAFTIDSVAPDGMKAASLEFFTGERNFPVPPVARTDVNPILKVYLQGDVYEMNRLTDDRGEARERWRYFQRRIKFALAEEAEVVSTRVTFEGRDHDALEVRFRPYSNDPRRDQFERFADKSYSIVISETLPGYLYSIKTRVPAEDPSAPPLVAETLELVEVAKIPADQLSN